MCVIIHHRIEKNVELREKSIREAHWSYTVERQVALRILAVVCETPLLLHMLLLLLFFFSLLGIYNSGRRRGEGLNRYNSVMGSKSSNTK